MMTSCIRQLSTKLSTTEDLNELRQFVRDKKVISGHLSKGYLEEKLSNYPTSPIPCVVDNFPQLIISIQYSCGKIWTKFQIDQNNLRIKEIFETIEINIQWRRLNEDNLSKWLETWDERRRDLGRRKRAWSLAFWHRSTGITAPLEFFRVVVICCNLL